jgi:hypothetical protein
MQRFNLFGFGGYLATFIPGLHERQDGPARCEGV